MRIYHANPRRQQNSCGGAVIAPHEEGGVYLFFLGRDGLPLNARWHQTLEEAHAEAREILGIEQSDWVECQNDPSWTEEVSDAMGAVFGSMAANNIQLPDPEVLMQETIAKYKEQFGIDLTDESFAPKPPDKVDVGSLTEPVVRDYEVFADFYQFYIWDIGIDPGPPTDCDDEDVRRMVRVADQCVVISTARNCTVPVQFEVRPDEPPGDDVPWDHIVDCSIELPTGQLQIDTGTSGAVADWRVPPGVYLLRAYFGKLDEVSANHLEGNDHYRVVMWRGDATPLKVIKQRPQAK